MTDNFAAAMVAARSDRVNRTFKTIEHMSAAALPHLEALVVLVSANLTFSHLVFPRLSYIEAFRKIMRDIFSGSAY